MPQKRTLWRPILDLQTRSDGFTMIVGPDRAAIFLEVGYFDGEQTHVIVHAMVAKEKFLR